MRNLFDVKGGKFLKIINAFAASADPAIGDAICDEVEGPKILEVMVAAAWEYLNRNPYEMTVEQQLYALRLANAEEKWGFTEEVFARLASTAPAWPKGRHAYRSLRIRFGEGDEGVAKTFEAHCTRIQHVFGKKRYWRWELLFSGTVEYEGTPVERLRLLSGNHTHHAVVEWIETDLDTYRKRASIRAVRDAKSLADELLVITWMFPDMIRAIDIDPPIGFFAAGYEVNVPENGGVEWRRVVFVRFDRIRRKVVIYVDGSGSDCSLHSVPRMRESPALAA